MAKVATAFLVVVGLWVSAEVFQQGPQEAFGGIFKSFSSSEEAPNDEPRKSTAQRAGGSVSRSQDEATARRERMLGE